MSSPSADSSVHALRAEAARWAVRRDRGLSAAESIEYELWLAADERRAAAMQRTSAAWSLLDRLPESAAAPVLAAATRRRSFWRRTVALGSLAAAAAVAVIGVHLWSTSSSSLTSSPSPANLTASASTPRQLILSDGSTVQLNAGSEVVEQFTPGERRVLLTRGEAHFAVTKNPARPFVVQAGALRVRAVGTAFDVNVQSAQIEVLVTEGRVQLTTSSAPPTPTLTYSPTTPLVEAGQRAVMPGKVADDPEAARGIVVSRVDADEMARVLAWQAPLLRLGGATLAELALEFQRYSGRRVILADPSLAQLRVGGRFRADDVDGFANLMATQLDLEVERTADGTLVLRKKNPK